MVFFSLKSAILILKQPKLSQRCRTWVKLPKNYWYKIIWKFRAYFVNLYSFMKLPLWREGGGLGLFFHVLLIWKYFYHWIAAFYGMKLSCQTKRLLSFEDWPSDKFSIEICRGNLPKFLGQVLGQYFSVLWT